MPTIISGMDPQARIQAYLSGQQSQRQLMALQQKAAIEQQELRHRYLQDIQKYRAQQAKSLEDVNARAQMGDVLAQRQQDIEASAARLPPAQRRLLERAELRKSFMERGYSEESLKQYDKDTEEIEKDIQTEEQRKALDEMVKSGITDGVITPEEIEQRRAMGEEPEQLGKEIATRKIKQRSDAIAMEKNTKALEKARAIAETIPETEAYGDKDQALDVIVGLETSPANMANPNAGKLVLDLVTRLAAKRGEQPKEESGFDFSQFSGVRNPFMGRAQAAVQQSPWASKTLKRQPAAAQDPAQAVMGILQQTRDPLEIAKGLKSQGIPLTPELQAIIRQALQGGQGAPAE